MKKFRYSNLFIYSSLQFCGNIEEYFAKNTKYLVAFVVLPRLKSKVNLLRVYREKKLIREEKVKSSENIFLYYFFWYLTYLRIIFFYFDRKEKLIVLSMHPISFFGMTIQKLVRNTEFIFWIGDYFPPSTLGIMIYEGLKKHYHDKLQVTYYLSDGINKVFNQKIINKDDKRTIMWGVKPKSATRSKTSNTFKILFVGLIKESQGIEFILNFLRQNRNYHVSIIGICNNTLYNKYQRTIKFLKISNQVFFPNKFYSDHDLSILARKCSVGIALYNIDKSNPTYYTDPGKVKAYAEMGLPVIMTRVSGVAKYIQRFNAGILIKRDFSELEKALHDIKKNYSKYKIGLEKFNKYFYFEDYYKNAFRALEL